ncbi:MAG TPA: methyltransferase domain-containing protein [Candidatus Limnocylindrales bacterium]|nr:methyltransferase domain-containing protein [Candidatus Limnocylindrales bacterium]
MTDVLDISCRACGRPVAAEPFVAREMLLETRESFEYVECSSCGSIQITEIPADLERYYPENYRLPVAAPGAIGRLLRKQRGAAVRGSRWNFVGRLMLSRLERPMWADWMIGTHAQADSRILDVGSANGELLIALSAAGFRDLTGIDPFVTPEENRSDGVRIFRRTIDAQEGTFDVVMLHHSLEHVAGPAESLRHVRRLLDPDGRALVRMPVAGGYGWRTYREHWIGIEPPRHLVIPSLEGMRLLAAQANLEIESIVYDTSGACYALSELWSEGRTFPAPRRPWMKRAIEMCGADRVAEINRMARQNDDARDGDTAAYYLRPLGSG